MKKKRILIPLLAIAYCFSFSQTPVCEPDTSISVAGIYPDSATGLSHACVDIPYAEVITNVVSADSMVDIPSFGLVDLWINYIRLDSVVGLPGEFSFGCEPDTCSYAGGTSGCILVSGNPTVLSQGSHQLFVYLTANVTAKPGQGMASVLIVDQDIPYLVDWYFLNVLSGPGISLTMTEEVCTGANGTATVVPDSGTGPLTYIWPTLTMSDTNAMAGGLVMGSYPVEVRDSLGCLTLDTAVIGQINDPPVLVTDSQDVSCLGNDGKAWVTATGNGGFTYHWFTIPPQTTDTAIGLSPGNYFVEVTDANGCKDSTSAQVNSGSGPSLNLVHTDALCGDDNGTATVTPSGNGPFTYSWNTNPVQSTATASGLPPGNYEVLVTDVGGCSTVGMVTIQDFDKPQLVGSVSQADCGMSNGWAAVEVTGSPPFVYLWSTSPPQTTDTAYGLSAGPIDVLVTDDNGCTEVLNLLIVNPNAPEFDTLIAMTSCEGGNTGSAIAFASGGTPPLTYSWSNGESGDTITGLIAGSYEVTVSDANGCIAIDQVTLPIMPALIVTADHTDEGCVGCNDGTASASATGGQSPYTFDWSNGESGGTLSNLEPGLYMVTVTDGRGCQAVDSVTVMTFVGINEEISKAIKINVYPNPSEGKINIEIESHVARFMDLQLVDMHGKVIGSRILDIQNERAVYSPRQLSSGLYYLKVGSGTSVVTRKVIVQ